MIEVKLPNLPEKKDFLRLVDILLILKQRYIRIEVGEHRLDIFPGGIYYINNLLDKQDYTRFKTMEPVLEKIYG